MRSFKKIFITAAALSLFATASCKKDILSQDPKSTLTPSFFTSSSGVLSGITGVYSDMRNLWGQEYFSTYTNAGTDETLAGGSAGNAVPLYTYASFIGNITNVYNGPIFQNCYQDINTLNGVLQYGPTAISDVPTRTGYLAQAKFLRALLYFTLVQTYGDIPLHTTFISTPTLSDSRQPIADVYKVIIQDLIDASTQLQTLPGETIASTGAASPFTGKAATKATALYLLAKVYLTRGWSTAAVSTDFQNALSTAQTLISNASTYKVGLWADYADAFRPANDYGQETLFVIDHSSDVKYGDFTAGAASGKINEWAYIFRPNYPTVVANYPTNSGSSVMTRDVANGRPFIRIRPNNGSSAPGTPVNPANDYILNQAFADRTNDFRYFNSFQTTWIANTANVSTPRGTLVVGQDTAIWTPPYDPGAAKRATFKGVIFVPPSLTGGGGNPYTNTMFPSLKKFDDPSRTGVNDPSTRPTVLFRFAEIYLIAAEAAFKMGDYATEATMLNVIRTRAAFRTAGQPAAPANAVANMQVTAAQLQTAGIDFILDERTREFYGEHLRWWDLTRTQSLVRRVKQYNAEAGPNILDIEVLRPIPQYEINAVTVGPPFTQNPGY